MEDPPVTTLKNERAAHWLSMGAIPSDAVARIMSANGLMERTPTQKTATKKNPDPVAAAPVAAAAPAAAPAPAAEEAPAEEESTDEAAAK
jgi:small subunit ribosomal protein S16